MPWTWSFFQYWSYWCLYWHSKQDFAPVVSIFWVLIHPSQPFMLHHRLVVTWFHIMNPSSSKLSDTIHWPASSHSTFYLFRHTACVCVCVKYEAAVGVVVFTLKLLIWEWSVLLTLSKKVNKCLTTIFLLNWDFTCCIGGFRWTYELTTSHLSCAAAEPESHYLVFQLCTWFCHQCQMQK